MRPSDAALGVVGLGLALVVGEGVARLGGRAPAPLPECGLALPILAPDPELGWDSVPGTHARPFHVDTGPVVILPDHSRATGPAPAAAHGGVVLVGDSYVHGWGVADRDTVGWRLRDTLGVDVRNHGVGAYSTVQAALRLRRLAARGEQGDVVVYGYVPLHVARNVAPWWWLEDLTRCQEGPHALSLPWGTVAADGSLVVEAAAHWPRVPGVGRSALAALLVETGVRLGTAGREATDVAVTDAAVRDLAATARAAGARFWIAALWAGAAEDLPRWRAQGLDVVDCTYPGQDDPASVVPGDGHPGPAAHAWWATCLADVVLGDRRPPG